MSISDQLLGYVNTWEHDFAVGKNEQTMINDGNTVDGSVPSLVNDYKSDSNMLVPQFQAATGKYVHLMSKDEQSHNGGDILDGQFVTQALLKVCAANGYTPNNQPPSGPLTPPTSITVPNAPPPPYLSGPGANNQSDLVVCYDVNFFSTDFTNMVNDLNSGSSQLSTDYSLVTNDIKDMVHDIQVDGNKLAPTFQAELKVFDQAPASTLQDKATVLETLINSLTATCKSNGFSGS